MSYSATKPVDDTTEDQAAYQPRNSLSVKAYGAVLDGIVDDTAAFQAAIDAAAAFSAIFGGQMSVYIPEGILLCGGVNPHGNNVRIFGAGIDRAIIRRNAGQNISLISTLLALKVTRFELSDLTLDGNRAAGAPGFTGNLVNLAMNAVKGGAYVYRVKFTQPLNTCIQVTGALGRTVVDECIFDGFGKQLGNGVVVSAGGRRVTVSRSVFRYLNKGITAGTTGSAVLVTGLDIINCEFDGGWYSSIGTVVGAPATTTYTATTVTDTAAAFTGNVAVGQPVRVMAAKAVGTAAVTFDNAASLTDTGVNFTTAGVKRGDLVRIAGGVAIVSSVASATKLVLEEWMSETDRQPIDLPAAATAYTVFGTVTGQVTAVAATTLTVNQWRDYDGTNVTPAAGTLYEVLPLPNYMINPSSGVQRVRILHNDVRRCWTDSIAPQCGRVIIIGNTVEDGQDNGIVTGGGVTAQHCIVTNNDVRHCGTNGLTTFGGTTADSIFADNVLADNVTFNTATGLATSLADLKLDGCQRVTAKGNIATRLTSTRNVNGYYVGSTAADVILDDNRSTGHTVGLTVIAGATGVKLRNGQSALFETVSDAGTGTDFGVIGGTGSPEGVVTAPPGTLYRRSNGGAGTSLYVKETGTGNTGWVGK